MEFVSLQWDMPVGDDPSVTYYETQVDARDWTNIGKPVIGTDGTLNTYSTPIGIKGVSIGYGAHTANVRACNASGCVTGTVLAFTVNEPPPPPPPPTPSVAPMNIRVVGN